MTEESRSIPIATGVINGGVSDAEAGFDIQPDFEGFHQKNDVFRRSWWDESIKTGKHALFYETYREPLKTFRKADGFTQRDYAFRNAAWHVSNVMSDIQTNEDRWEGFTDPYSLYQGIAAQKQEPESPAAGAAEIKTVSKAFGADLVGIAALDPRWIYKSKFSDKSLTERTNEIPEGMTSVIVTAQAMDYDLIRTVPSALSGAATGLGYSYDAMVVLSIAQYIRNLGYNAVASLNDTALAIPMAVQAGLGEYGKNGLLITEEFGPRLRLGKIFTDMPLAHDRPKQFGVKEFCNQCNQCVKGCPAKAIRGGEPSAERFNMSNIKGIVKWSVDGVKCFNYWAAQNSDCSICIRTCPYNKDYSKWYHRIGVKLAGTRLRGLMLWLDQKMGYGERMKPKLWWQNREDPA